MLGRGVAKRRDAMSDQMKPRMSEFEQLLNIANGLLIACRKLVNECHNCRNGRVIIMGEDYGECPLCGSARTAIDEANVWIMTYMEVEA
jgi:Zn finger protein HypA/HybF involved in hydrogenase expression